MERFFNMDNKFFVFMGRVADLILLNLLCVVCCLPIITIGPSITALFYVTLKMVRNEESYIFRSFFKSFKENFKQSAIINVIMLLVGVLLYFDMIIVSGMDGAIKKVLFFAFMFILLLYTMVFMYIYPVLSKFYNSIKNTFINAFLMALRHLPYTILMIVVTLLPAGIFWIPSAMVQSTLLMLFVLFGFAAIAYVNSYFLVKIFDKYIPKEEDAQENPSDTGVCQ